MRPKTSLQRVMVKAAPYMAFWFAAIAVILFNVPGAPLSLKAVCSLVPPATYLGLYVTARWIKD